MRSMYVRLAIEAPDQRPGGSSEEEDDMADVFGYSGYRVLLAARHIYRNRDADMLKRTYPGTGWAQATRDEVLCVNELKEVPM